VACLFDNECTGLARCVAGTCQAPTSCTTSLDCKNLGTTTICDDVTKSCVQCADNADCSQKNQVCAANVCVDSGKCTPGDAGASSGPQCKPGQVCSPAGECVECVADKDCTGGNHCFSGTCRTPCASDNACLAKNQLCDKTLGACVDCLNDKGCDTLQYCKAGSCVADVCAQGVKSCVGNSIVECTANGDGILPPVACADGTQCVKSGTNATCEVPTLPDGGKPPPASCADGKKNGTETDVDCGGACPKCADGLLCGVATDCTSGVCEAACTGLLCFPGTRDKVCRPAQCSDGVKNGAETSIDCGGADCSRCAVGDTCKANADCQSNICTGGKCVAAACTADQCNPCLLPTDAPCCTSNGLCGCATVFPFKGTCQ
jgi:hypothetical protein